jgi:hemolysin D
LEYFATAQKQINQLEANREQILFSNQKQKITAPCDGYVDKLLTHTIGGVVTPAEKLIALTPVEKPLVIKAQVLNRDIGFIKVGMPVSIKIDTFESQKYGILDGKVKSISQNSIVDEKLGPIYEVYITPITKTFIVDGQEKDIATGMTLNAEININKRRIIDFFIYPLIKYMDEGISVR